MTVNKTLVSVWGAFALLVSGFIVAEYHFLTHHAKNASSNYSMQGPPFKKIIFDYTTFKSASEQLHAKNKFLTSTYQHEQAQPEVITYARPSRSKHSKKRSMRSAQGKKRKGVLRQSTPVIAEPKKSLGRRKASSKKTLAKRIPARVRKVSKGTLRKTSIKPVKMKTGAVIRPTTANTAWRNLQREPLFSWPVEPSAFWVSSLFGPRKLGGKRGFHAGIDLAAVRGTPVYAAGAGIITEAAYSSGYGNYIVIAHNRKYKTRYAHLDKIHVCVGDSVCAGDCIGRVGATGYVRKSRRGGSASHLHFEVYMKGKPVNPFYFLA